ncbi:MAG: M28 family peptidase [Dehalococcoidia bacterium]
MTDMIRDGFLPAEKRIFAWIEEVFGHGVRRPGYPADRWAERWAQEQFRGFGLERVRAEPVEMPYWEPIAAALTVSAGVRIMELPCFALPLCVPGVVEAELAAFDADAPARVQGAIALADAPLMRVPHAWYANMATWHYDPAGTFGGSQQVLPFSRQFQDAMEPALDAGALGFVGTLSGYPGDSHDYYVPYDGKHRPIPGVWVSGSDGARLRELLAAGPVRARLRVDARREMITSYNIVGELAGADDEAVIIGSHHDGPWSSAVEDSSGIALVLAQAAYWSQVRQGERPHRLVFLLNSGHMAGGAGQRTFVETHRSELDRVVLEVHLEHTANEFAEQDGALRPTGHPEARWWFTSRIGRLEAAVRAAIEAEDLTRSLMLRPDAFGPKPTTDGADFFLAGVPLVNFLTAPFYLFDAMDTLDKIHRPSLVPVTRAAARIIASTAGVSAAAMRADTVE